jgi:hypothetical protein
MSNGVRVDKARLDLGGLETLSKFEYDGNDWLRSDQVGDALHTISYDYNPRGWLTEINSIAPPPPVASDDCDPPGPVPFPNFPMCIEIGDVAILQILYNCAALLAGTPTTVIVNIQTQSGQQMNPIAMNGSDGRETDQTESFDFTISSTDDIALLNNILSTLFVQPTLKIR